MRHGAAREMQPWRCSGSEATAQARGRIPGPLPSIASLNRPRLPTLALGAAVFCGGRSEPSLGCGGITADPIENKTLCRLTFCDWCQLSCHNSVSQGRVVPHPGRRARPIPRGGCGVNPCGPRARCNTSGTSECRRSCRVGWGRRAGGRRRDERLERGGGGGGAIGGSAGGGRGAGGGLRGGCGGCGGRCGGGYGCGCGAAVLCGCGCGRHSRWSCGLVGLGLGLGLALALVLRPAAPSKRSECSECSECRECSECGECGECGECDN